MLVNQFTKRLLPSAGDPAMNVILCDLLMGRACERVPLAGFPSVALAIFAGISMKWGIFRLQPWVWPVLRSRPKVPSEFPATRAIISRFAVQLLFMSAKLRI